MMTKVLKLRKIEKEMIANLLFPKSEVLNSRFEIDDRNEDLSKALVFGTVEHQKVRIAFEGVEGRKEVETTIWGVTSSEVILKQNVVIPIHRIVKIEIL